MLKLIILFLYSISAWLILSQILPVITGRYEAFQKRKLEKTTEKLDKMYVDVRKERVNLAIWLTPVVLPGLAYVFTQNMLAIGGSFLVGLVLPSMVVRKLEEARKAKFQTQLLDAISILGGALKSGMSIFQAIEVIVEEMPAPLSVEFGLVLNETKLGMTPEEALERLNKRMYSEELNMLVTSVLVVRNTGGDLTKIFDNLVYTIRQKNKITSQLKSLTVQARAQGMVLMFLPFVFAFSVAQMSPGFFNILFESDKGRVLMIYAIFSQFMGMYILKKLSKIEI